MLTSRRGLPASLRQDQKRRVWPLLVAVLALAVTGCEQPGTGMGRSDAATTSTPPATVMVGPDDGGRTVDLGVGDRLIVQLDTAKLPSRFLPGWTLRLPPSEVLKRVQGGPETTRVVLVADGPGTVRLLLVKRASCAPPLRCPLAAASPTSERARMRPPLAGVTVVITVRVR